MEENQLYVVDAPQQVVPFRQLTEKVQTIAVRSKGGLLVHVPLDSNANKLRFKQSAHLALRLIDEGVKKMLHALKENPEANVVPRDIVQLAEAQKTLWGISRETYDNIPASGQAESGGQIMSGVAAVPKMMHRKMSQKTEVDGSMTTEVEERVMSASVDQLVQACQTGGK